MNEYKQYEKYTDPVTEEEIKAFNEDGTPNIYVRNGHIQFSEHFFIRLSIKANIGEEVFYFEPDDLTDFIFKNHNDQDTVTVEFFFHPFKHEYCLISYTNHDQKHTIVNRKAQSLLGDIAYFRLKCFDLLSKYYEEEFFFFVLSKNTNSEYEYKLEKIERPSDYRDYNPFRKLVLDYTKMSESEATFYLYRFGGRGAFIDIPNSDKTIFYSHHTSYKKKDCRCGAKDYKNFSLPVGGSYADYFCPYCFFDQNGIEVPEHFFEEINKEV